ncbi:hypothetical protein DVH05_000718 [Phytophthora capsici]|nr:hypothetical protein DVH05_000718 [Phytophthora capsici]
MSEHKDVAYRPLHKREELYYFTWNAENECYKVSLERDPGCFYEGLFDGDDEGGAWYGGHFVHSYLFASPRTKNYNSFVKEDCTKIYMNPWTTEECKKYVDKVVNPSIQPGPDTLNEWFMRYKVIGGKPRLLFPKRVNLDALVKDVEAAIPATFEELKEVFHAIHTGRSNVCETSKHILFALFRNKEDPSRCFIDFASEIIECKTFPSIDGVLVVPEEKLVIYLQTTVSLKHSIQHEALKGVIDVLVKKQGFADYTHIFLFLAMADTYDHFKKQRFKTRNNEDRQKNNNFGVVLKQYVGKIEGMEANTGSAAPSPTSHKRTSSEASGEESDVFSSEGDTTQRGGTKNPKAPAKRRSSTKTSSRSKKRKVSN